MFVGFIIGNQISYYHKHNLCNGKEYCRDIPSFVGDPVFYFSFHCINQKLNWLIPITPIRQTQF